MKYRKRFEAVRSFTLESGQQEIERQNERRKAKNSFDSLASTAPSQSSEDLRSSLSRIPEENGPFAIGDDDSDDEREDENTAPPSTQTSRRPSVSSAVDESVPLQLRGMSEKARGKMPAGHPTFSRQNSMTSQSSVSGSLAVSPSGFTPTAAWVSDILESMKFLCRTDKSTSSSNPGCLSFPSILSLLLSLLLHLTFPSPRSKRFQTQRPVL